MKEDWQQAFNALGRIYEEHIEAALSAADLDVDTMIALQVAIGEVASRGCITYLSADPYADWYRHRHEQTVARFEMEQERNREACEERAMRFLEDAS